MLSLRLLFYALFPSATFPKKIKNVSFVSVNFSANEPYVIHIKYYTKNKYGLCKKKILYAKFDTFLVYDGGWFLSFFFKFWVFSVAKNNNLYRLNQLVRPMNKRFRVN